MKTSFKPIPRALIERIQVQTAALAAAADPDTALRALFLLHCECRDAVAYTDPVKAAVEIAATRYSPEAAPVIAEEV